MPDSRRPADPEYGPADAGAESMAPPDNPPPPSADPMGDAERREELEAHVTGMGTDA